MVQLISCSWNLKLDHDIILDDIATTSQVRIVSGQYLDTDLAIARAFSTITLPKSVTDLSGNKSLVDS